MLRGIPWYLNLKDSIKMKSELRLRRLPYMIMDFDLQDIKLKYPFIPTLLSVILNAKDSLIHVKKWFANS